MSSASNISSSGFTMSSDVAVADVKALLPISVASVLPITAEPDVPAPFEYPPKLPATAAFPSDEPPSALNIAAAPVLPPSILPMLLIPVPTKAGSAVINGTNLAT